MSDGFFGKVKNLIGMSEYEEDEAQDELEEEKNSEPPVKETVSRETAKIPTYPREYPTYKSAEKPKEPIVISNSELTLEKASSKSAFEAKSEIKTESRLFSRNREEKEIIMDNKQTGSLNVPNQNFKMIVIEPKSFDECPKLVDSLKARKPIIINLEKVESDTARKIFDFLSGATYALNGNMQKVSNNIFLFAPDNVDITAQQDGGRYNESKSPWR